MPLTSNQRYYALYVIAEVETHWTWTSADAVNPIQIGIVQWYGTRAAHLLEQVQAQDAEGFALLAESLRSSLSAHPSSDTYWNTRYLTKSECDSWVSAASRNENHAIQEQQFIADMTGYESILEEWGCKSDTPDHAKALIFAASMYHQSPRAAGNVVRGVGGQDLDRLHSGALNNGTFSRYKNRYNTVYNRLREWDGTSAPPDFGQDGDINPYPGENSGEGTGTLQSAINHIRVNGNELIVYGNQTENGLICVRAANGFYYPRTRVENVENPGSGTSGGGGGSPQTDIEKMQQLWIDNEERWAYGQGAGHLDPPSSGYSDCAACIWWAVNEIRPDISKNLGTWCGALVYNGTEIARGTRGQKVDTSLLQKGDLFLVNWTSPDLYAANGRRHVEWYFGDGQLWGAGSAPLPHRSGDINDYVDMVAGWMVRRAI